MSAFARVAGRQGKLIAVDIGDITDWTKADDTAFPLPALAHEATDAAVISPHDPDCRLMAATPPDRLLPYSKDPGVTDRIATAARRTIHQRTTT
jgi:hypothetical protein